MNGIIMRGELGNGCDAAEALDKENRNRIAIAR